MVDLSGFDPNVHEPLAGFDPIPAADYTAVIIDSEKKATKAGNGEYLELTWQIVEGEHEGRLLWQRINLQHPSERAVEFGHRMLSSICRAVGKMQIRDSSELHNISCSIRVKIRRGADGYADSNEVVRAS